MVKQPWGAFALPMAYRRTMPESESCQLEDVTIVLLGQFNPPIFLPAWFGRQGLLPQEEAERAQLLVVHPEVAAFQLDWLRVEVRQDRLISATTSAAHFEALRDLIVGTFQVLGHTPIQKMGVNRDMHFRTAVERASGIADRFAPKAPWLDIVESPRLRALTIEGVRPGATSKRLRVRVEPSLRVEPGVFIGVNEHFEAPPTATGAELTRLLETEWTGVLDHARTVAAHILNPLSDRTPAVGGSSAS